MPMNEHEEQVITRNTRVTLGLVGAIFGFLLSLFSISFGAYTWLQSEFTGIRAEIAILQSQLQLAADERWRLSNMEAWTYRLQLENPELSVPDPLSPSGVLTRKAPKATP